MKKVIVFLLAAVLLAGAAPEAQAQKRNTLTTAEANSLLQKMNGTWEVKTMIWQPDQNKFFESVGKASFSRPDGLDVREQFEITQPDGSTKRVEGLLRYSEINECFEFIQQDENGVSNLLLCGKWDPRFNMISFTPVKKQRLPYGAGKPRMQWQYFFFDDGSFKKVVRTPDHKGRYMLASEYHCILPNTAGL